MVLVTDLFKERTVGGITARDELLASENTLGSVRWRVYSPHGGAIKICNQTSTRHNNHKPLFDGVNHHHAHP